MFVEALPEAMDAAAAGLGGIGASVVAGNAAAAFPTTGVIPPAPEPTSVLLAGFFGTHGGMYQAFAAEAALIHQMFVATMGASAGSYAASEAFNTLAMA
jgi:hypothetical protein